MSSDSSPQPHAAPGQALDDAPVGSAASKRPPRAHEWTRARMDAFLRELGATLSVSRAARSVGMSRQSAYRLRARLKGQPFDRAWAAAFDHVFNALAHAAMERAIHGVPVPYLHKGEIVHTGRRYDERLTLGLLKMRYALLPDPAPFTSNAAAFEADDFPGLLSRVGEGPESWDGA